MNFKPTHFDADVWIRGSKRCYNYIGTHTNEVLVVDVNPTSIFNKFKETYTIKDFGLPNVHIGCDCSQVKKGDTNKWVMGYSTYAVKALRKVCVLLNIVNLQKEKWPSSPSDHTRLDSSPLLGEEQYRLYQKLVGISYWMVKI